MNRWVWTGIGLAMGMTAVLAGADPKPLTVKEIMGKLNKGPYAMTPSIKKELQKDNPDWIEIQDQTKQYTTLTAGLTKNEPPKGDKESWEKLVKQYADDAKALDDAAKKKDKRAALTAHTKLTNACNGCHKAHKN